VRDGREEDEERLSGVLRQHKREYERLQQAFRAANLAARRTTDAIAARRRAELLAGGDPAARHLKAAAEGDLTAASAGITDALRRTARTMAQALSCLQYVLRYPDILARHESTFICSFPSQGLYRGHKEVG
jgi:hypothetical protein